MDDSESVENRIQVKVKSNSIIYKEVKDIWKFDGRQWKCRKQNTSESEN